MKKIFILSLSILLIISLLLLNKELTLTKNKIIVLENNINELTTALKIEIEKPDPESVVIEIEKEEVRIGGGEVRLFKWPLLSDDNTTTKTSPFGERRSPFQEGMGFHTGLDIAGLWKARIIAARDGVVIDHYPPPGVYNGKRYFGHPVYGGWIVVKHSDGWVTTYAHLSESYVKIGTKVKTGQVIGRQGNTGKSKGDHLHFEILKDGEYVNPILYLEEMTN